jgi:hypothetical protein
MPYGIHKKAYSLISGSFTAGDVKGDDFSTYTGSGSLQAWWRFNTDLSSGDAIDESGNDQNASWPVSRPALSTFNTPSKYIQESSNTFLPAGDVYATEGTATDWDGLVGSSGTSKMTFALWLSGSALATEYITRVGTSPGIISLHRNVTSLRFLTTWNGSSETARVDYGPTTCIDDGGWKHIAVTYDASSADNNPIIYWNGEPLKLTAGFSSPSAPWGSVQTSGFQISDALMGIDGNLADCAVWNSILTPIEIKALYRTTLYGSFDIFRDYAVIGSHATPPFTGSYGSTLQGLNVNTFERFGMSAAPKMGRSDNPRVFLSSSTGVRDVTTDDKNFFDAALRLPEPISFEQVIGKMATGSVGMATVASAGDKIELRSIDDLIITYTAATTRDYVKHEFARGASNSDSIASLASIVTSSEGHGDRFVVSASANTLHITQSTSGQSANNEINVAVTIPGNYSVAGFVGGAGATNAVSIDGTAYLATSQQVIGDDDYKVIQLPQHRLSRQTFGLEPLFTQQHPFVEMDAFDPVIYLTDPLRMSWPVVLENPSPLDPFDFNGAIEPFALRRPLAGFSTFIGNHEDPEPTGIKGSVSSGMLQGVFYRNSAPAGNFYFPGAPEIAPFDMIGAEEGYDETGPLGFQARSRIGFLWNGAKVQNVGETITLSGWDGFRIVTETYTAGTSNDIPTRTFDKAFDAGAAYVNALINFTNIVNIVQSASLSASIEGGWSAGGYDYASIVQNGEGTRGNTWIASSLSYVTCSSYYGFATSSFYEGVDQSLAMHDYVKPLAYMTDATGSISPFIDYTSTEDAFYNVSNGEIRKLMERLFTKADQLGIPGRMAKSAPCGWDFENSSVGIDSITFGGLKK